MEKEEIQIVRLGYLTGKLMCELQRGDSPAAFTRHELLAEILKWSCSKLGRVKVEI